MIISQVLRQTRLIIVQTFSKRVRPANIRLLLIPHSDPYSNEVLLANVRKTYPGNDRIPYWVFRDCTEGLSQGVTKLINYCLCIGKVPSAWKITAVTPVPKPTRFQYPLI